MTDLSPRNGSFIFKVFVSFLSLILVAGVMALFNMNVLLVRLDERFVSFERRIIVIENDHTQLRHEGVFNHE